eukprot:TRINITY_DN11310_c0_g1_i4.p1 TRINITY_DN11310_c0_g1~~TRINITY_DN11310_c0_g1_i4.p1  ORF type:complete len:630 (+),score=128.87 TRINITY_DN11310_c0_g1_i4:100-1989(+)
MKDTVMHWRDAHDELPRQLPRGDSRSSAEMGVPLDADPHLGILCTEVLMKELHFEYVFHVTHPCGCSWQVSRRYNDMLQMHEELTRRFDGLPPFPPKRSLGQRFTISERDAANKRVIALQRYLQLLSFRKDVLGPPHVLGTLGAEAPEAVRAVRVASWHFRGGGGASAPSRLPNPHPGATVADVVLEVDHAPLQAEGCCRPVEGFEARVRILPNYCSRGRCEIDGATFSVALGDTLRIRSLPCGSEVEISVCAWNAVGTSPPVVVCFAVPGEQQDSSRHFDINPNSSRGGHGLLSGTKLTSSPFSGKRQINIGCKVLAVWAGDGEYYDAVVRHVERREGMVTVDWLRPAPLASEVQRCVCEAGGDDTLHRRVPTRCVRLSPPRGFRSPPHKSSVQQAADAVSYARGLAAKADAEKVQQADAGKLQQVQKPSAATHAAMVANMAPPRPPPLLIPAAVHRFDPLPRDSEVSTPPPTRSRPSMGPGSALEAMTSSSPLQALQEALSATGLAPPPPSADDTSLLMMCANAEKSTAPMEALSATGLAPPPPSADDTSLLMMCANAEKSTAPMEPRLQYPRASQPLMQSFRAPRRETEEALSATGLAPPLPSAGDTTSLVDVEGEVQAGNLQIFI